MESKIIFSCPWQRNKETSWSGTHRAVYNRIQNYYPIMDFDWGDNQPYTFVSKIFGKLTKKNQLLNIAKHFNKRIEKKLKGSQYDSLQFSFVPDLPNVNSFVYMDLCYPYILQRKKTRPEVFLHSSWQKYSDSELVLLSEKTEEFFSHPNVHVLARGHWYADWLVDSKLLPKDRVHQVGGGINVGEENVSFSNREGNKFLFVGKDFDRKNGPLVIEAFREFRKKHPDFLLYVAGPGGLAVHDEGIIFLGEVPFNELKKYFARCDFFILPSVFEAYGLVFPEAQSYGRPCIGRNAFEMPYFIHEGTNGYLLQKQDKYELAQLMEKVSNNTAMITLARNNASHILKEYSWDEVISKIDKARQNKQSFQD